jgi:hypothetical protein
MPRLHTYSILTLRLSAASTGLISFHAHHSAGGTLVLLLPLSVWSLVRVVGLLVLHNNLGASTTDPNSGKCL